MTLQRARSESSMEKSCAENKYTPLLPLCHRLNISGNESMVSCLLAAGTGLFFLIFKIFSLLSPCHPRLLTSQSVFPPLFFPFLSLFLRPLPGPALLHPELLGEAADMRQEMSVTTGVDVPYNSQHLIEENLTQHGMNEKS